MGPGETQWPRGNHTQPPLGRLAVPASPPFLGSAASAHGLGPSGPRPSFPSLQSKLSLFRHQQGRPAGSCCTADTGRVCPAWGTSALEAQPYRPAATPPAPGEGSPKACHSGSATALCVGSPKARVQVEEAIGVVTGATARRGRGVRQGRMPSGQGKAFGNNWKSELPCTHPIHLQEKGITPSAVRGLSVHPGCTWAFCRHSGPCAPGPPSLHAQS